MGKLSKSLSGYSTERVEIEEEERQLQEVARRLVNDVVSRAKMQGKKRLTMGPANTSYDVKHINIIEQNRQNIEKYDQQAASTAKRLAANVILHAQTALREASTVSTTTDASTVLTSSEASSRNPNAILAVQEPSVSCSKISSRNSIDLYGTDDHRFGEHLKIDDCEFPKIHHGLTPRSSTSLPFKPGEAAWRLDEMDDDFSAEELPKRTLRRPPKFRPHSTREDYSSVPPINRLPKLKFKPLVQTTKEVARADSKSVRVGLVCPRAASLPHDKLLNQSIYHLRRHYNSQDCCVWDSWIPIGGRRPLWTPSTSMDNGSTASRVSRHAQSLSSTQYSRQRDASHVEAKNVQRTRFARESVWQ